MNALLTTTAESRTHKAGSRIGLGIAAVAGLLLQACASTGFDRNIDVAEAAQFEDYKTYAWISDQPVINTSGTQIINSPVQAPHIREAVEAELEAKGYRRVPKDQADLVVAVRTASQDKVRVTTYYDNFGYSYYGFNRGFSRFGRYGNRFHRGFGRGFGSGIGTSTVSRTSTEGSLIVDFFDSRTKEAIWHGSASKTIKASDSVPAYIAQAAMELLSSFPEADKMSEMMKEMMG